MSKCYIINTNKKYDFNSEQEMIQYKKCSAYGHPWTEHIDNLQLNDVIFLYSNKNGIIATGLASGIAKAKDYKGKVDEEHYMKLNNFKILKNRVKYKQINNILNRNVVLGRTQIKLEYEDGLKIWQYITKNCLIKER
ncbi:hypothetical protein [Clostridium pasteurianum]|uniref:EVE domain-containing protein n=1 Tax=Clostridium pasteurianum BC1 TaxID=86416 RepID=R4KDK3_CLOPA|nr:hypothetical protein [Clostridium pasteurianum]AGK97700.1 hypothetical protein Clopa_2862 [Clostridium pasteurianum BC1]